MTAKSEMSASLSYQLHSPAAYMSICVPVLSDYRNLIVANDLDHYRQGVSATMSYRHRNPLTSFFTNVSLTFNHDRNAIMSNQLITDDFIISTWVDRVAGCSSWLLTGGMSKGLCHSHVVAGYDISASTSCSTSMRNNIIEDFSQQALSIKPYFRGSIFKWLSANYDITYGVSQLKISGDNHSTQSFNQKLLVSVIPLEQWQFSAGAEHFLTRFPEGNTKNLILIDASAVWLMNNKTRLSLTGTNLLNQRQYQYVTYGTLSRSEHSFSIRPRNILATLQYRF